MKLLRAAALLLPVIAFVIQPSTSQAALGAVDCNQNPGSLQSGIFESNPGDTLQIIGTCVGNFIIDKPMTLQGGAINGNNTGTALTVSPGSGSVTIQDTTISGGGGLNGDNGLPGAGTDGKPGGPGGLDIKNGDVTVKFVTVSGNTGGAGGNGSSVSSADGGNGGRGGAGGVLVEGGNVSFMVDDVKGNAGGAGGNGYGPAVVAGNGGDAGAGGLEVDNGTVTLTNTMVENNGPAGASSLGGSGGDSVTDPGSGGRGGTGGISVAGGALTVITSTISGNRGSGGAPNAGSRGSGLGYGTEGTGGAGGVLASSGSINFYNSTVSGNSSGAGGGGFFVGEGRGPDGDGGGTAINGGNISLLYTTVSSNNGSGGTNDLANRGGTISATASIIADPVVDGQAPAGNDCAGTMTNDGYDLFGTGFIDGTTGSTYHECTISPLPPDTPAGSPASYTTFSAPATTQPGTLDGYLKLLPLTTGVNSTPIMPEVAGSPSIGLIPQAACDAGFSGPSGSGIPNPNGGDLIFTDQRGVSRAHGTCDAGSFQMLRAPTVDIVHDATNDTGISQTDGVTSNNQPRFQGSLPGTAGFTATIYDNGTAIGTAVIGSASNFFFKPSSALSDGTHQITATVADPDAGVNSPASAAATVVIRSTPPTIDIFPENFPISSDGSYPTDMGSSTLKVDVAASDAGGITSLSCSDGTTNLVSDSPASAPTVVTDSFTLAGGSHSIHCSASGVAGNQGSVTQTMNVHSSSISSVSGRAVEGGTATFRAFLQSGGSGLDGKTIVFSLSNGSGGWDPICGGSGQPLCPSTQKVDTTDGVATLSGVTLPGAYTGVGTYTGAVRASFAGDASTGGSTGTGDLDVMAGGIVTNCSGDPSRAGSLPYEVGHTGLSASIAFQDGLDCSGLNAVTVTSPVSVAANRTVTVDATGHTITVQGSGSTEVFDVLSGGSLTLTGLSLSNGHLPSGSVGAIENHGTLHITNSTLFQMSASAITNSGALTISESTLTANSSAAGGAIDNLNGGNATVAFSTLSGNSASDRGGAIDNLGTVTILDSTLSGNTATNTGGAIENEGGNLTLMNSTVAGNTAAAGGAIHTTNTASSALTTVGGDILAGNDGGDCVTPSGSIADEGYNMDPDSSCFNSGTGDSSSDPQLDLAGLQNNGGPTQTIALQSGSPAIDQIPTSDATLCRLHGSDQRGDARPDGTETSCDIGAYEFADPTSQTITFSLATLPDKRYGDASFDISSYASVPSGLPVSFSSATTDVCAVSGSTVTILAVGTCTVNADQAGNSTYSAAEQVQQSFTVGTKSLTVTAGTPAGQTYGDTSSPNVSCTADGLVGSDGFSTSPSGAVFDSTGTTQVTISSSSAAGSYVTKCSGADAGSNYSISYVPGTFTINRADLAITVQVPATYGDTLPSLTGISPTSPWVTVTGLAGSDTIGGTLSCTKPGGVTVDGSNHITAGSGIYRITSCILSGLTVSSNYNAPTLGSGTDAAPHSFVDVGKRAITVTADDQEFTYGSSSSYTAGVTGGSLANGDTLGSLGVTCSATDGQGNPVTTATNAGTYSGDITCSGGNTTDYTYTYQPGTLTIDTKVVHVTAGHPDLTYGDPRPTSGYTTDYTAGDFVGGDTSSVVSGSLSCDTTYTKGADVGTYAITCSSTLSATNYTFVSGYSGTSDTSLSSTEIRLGTLTVNRAATDLTLSSSANPSAAGQSVTFSATVSSAAGTPTGTVTFTDGSAVLGTGQINPSGVATLTMSSLAVGAHSITSSYGGDPNFLTSSAQVSLSQNVDTSLSNFPRLSSGAYNLGNASLAGAYLWGWNLAGASLVNGNFKSANFSSAILTGANLTGGNFSSADFTGANLSIATLNQANLSSANLTNANLNGATKGKTAKLRGVIWSNTTCPDGTNSNANNGTCAGHL